MNEFADRLAASLVTVTNEADLERDFEARLADSSVLAFRVAFSIVRHRQDAEDVAQEAFVRAHRNFRRLRNRHVFRTWLVRIVWRLAIDQRRSHTRRLVREQATPQSGIARGTEEEAIIARERSAQLWQAVDELPEKLRVVIVLAALEEHGIREVAELLGLPEGTVKSRLFLARQRLKERLQ